MGMILGHMVNSGGFRLSEQNISSIFPLYEGFYIEAMLFNSSAALSAWDESQELLRIGDEYFLNEIQNFLTHSGILSRYFWPAREKPPFSDRGAFLRKVFNLDDESPLKNRDLRNTFEHLDEKLDEWLKFFPVGRVMPEFIGESTFLKEPSHFFRAYFVDLDVFEVLGNKYAIKPIQAEVLKVHNKLVEALDNGLRFTL